MRVRKFDSNDSGITRALREAGAVVWHLDCHEPGRPDKLVGFLGRLYLLEIKAPKTGRLSREQQDAHGQMAKVGVRVCIVRTVREAFEAVGITGKRAAQNQRALSEIALNLRKKSDDFERRARLVSSVHDFRTSTAPFRVQGANDYGRDPQQRYRTPEGDPWADPGSMSKIPDRF
jgi:hypothetical protein